MPKRNEKCTKRLNCLFCRRNKRHGGLDYCYKPRHMANPSSGHVANVTTPVISGRKSIAKITQPQQRTDARSNHLSCLDGHFAEHKLEEELLPEGLYDIESGSSARVTKVLDGRRYGKLRTAIAKILEQYFPSLGKFQFAQPMAFLAKTKTRNPHANGALHRDYNGFNVGYVSAFLFLDGTPDGTGGIRFWKESELVDVDDKKNPGYQDKALTRNLKKLKTFYVKPQRGKLLLWDARIVHQAIANRSQNWRCAVGFIAHPESLPLLKRMKINDSVRY